MAVVLGYHGCSKRAAQELLGGIAFLPSDKPYDWLGEGSYFWENDIQRAYEWARERRTSSPCVVGAVIDLGNCLDLTTRRGAEAVRLAYENYSELQKEYGEPLPANLPAKDGDPEEFAVRRLDRAVIDHLHSIYKRESEADGGRTREFDSVRAMFPEGQRLYANAGFRAKTHVQVAVRKETQVLGVFRVPAFQFASNGLPDDLYDFRAV